VVRYHVIRRSTTGQRRVVELLKRLASMNILTSDPVLQQTRVSTVIPYFNNWISTWPTVERLAEANHDEVLSAWKGLGYYSRATRLHEGAKQMMAKSSGSTCPIPNEAVKLQNFPGIGRYTAGAISSIVFGEAEPVLDGNVARVLSRQLGVYMDVKDKKTSEMLWSEADRLVKHVSTLSGTGVSAVPGQWNQALMELGSTICTPRPRCDDCPIQATCRVYSEGLGLSKSHQPPAAIPDIEDACTLCDDLDFESLATAGGVLGEENAPNTTKRRKGNAKQSNTISQYFATGTPSVRPNKHDGASVSMDNRSEANGSKKRKLSACEVASHSDSISAYCSLFPKKVAKKKVAEEECVVCIIEMRLSDGSSKWLIEQRPARGKSSLGPVLCG
jgi:A/G-specific adenine glycosylase